jgi:hypothetical protein
MNKIILLFMVALIVFSIVSNPAHAWLTGWKYRIQKNVTNMDNNAVIGMTANITMDTATLITAGKMDSDCRFRVTNATDYIITDYAIDVCDDAASNITFKSDYGAGETKSFYVYYKNPAASLTNQSWDSVYWAVAENCSNPLDMTTKWNATNVTSGDYVYVEDGLCIFNKTSSGAYWSNGIVYKPSSLSIGSLHAIIRANYSGSNNDAVFFMQLTNQTNFGWDRYGLSTVTYGWHGTYSPNERTGIQNSTHWIFYEGAPPFANLNIIEMRMNVTHYEYTINGSLRSSGTWQANDLNSTPSFWISRSGYYGGMAWMDYVYVRQVSMEEPTIASGSEEESLFPMIVNSNTSIPQDTYYINDTEGAGIITINASNVTFDCNNSLFIGNNSGILFKLNDGKTGINITNCGITNYSYSVTDNGFYDTGGDKGTRVSHFTNNTIRNSRYNMWVYDFSYNHVYDTTSGSPFYGLWGTWEGAGEFPAWKTNMTITYNYLNNSNLLVACPRNYYGVRGWGGCFVYNNEIYNYSGNALTLLRQSWGSTYGLTFEMSNNIMKYNGVGVWIESYWTPTFFPSDNNTITDNGIGYGAYPYGYGSSVENLWNSTVANNSAVDLWISKPYDNGANYIYNVTYGTISSYWGNPILHHMSFMVGNVTGVDGAPINNASFKHFNYAGAADIDGTTDSNGLISGWAESWYHDGSGRSMNSTDVIVRKRPEYVKSPQTFVNTSNYSVNYLDIILRDCLAPVDDYSADESGSIYFCSGTYNQDDVSDDGLVKVAIDNLELIGNNTLLIGTGAGINNTGYNNFTVRDANISYTISLYFKDSNSYLKDSKITGTIRYDMATGNITGSDVGGLTLGSSVIHVMNTSMVSDTMLSGGAYYRDWYGYKLNVYGWNGSIAGANAYLYGAAWNFSLGSTDSQGNTTFNGLLPQYYTNATGRYNSSVSASKSGWKSNSMGASMVANNVHEGMKLKMFAEPELYLNGVDDDVYITFATTLNVTSMVNGGLGSQSGLILMLNGTPISSPDIGKHSAGLFNYTSTFSENADFASLIGSVTHYAWIDICSSGTCRVIRDVGGGIGGLFTAISNPLAYIMLILGIVAGALVVFYGVVTIIVRLI